MAATRSTALGAALLAGAAVNLFGWDLTRPDTFLHVNEAGATRFEPKMSKELREKKWREWNRAVERARGWDEDKEE
jgi:glycerol kinase